MLEIQIKTLLDLSIERFASLLEDAHYTDLLWAKVLVDNFYFTPKISNELLKAFSNKNALSDKYFSIFSSPIIFPFTKLIIDKNSGASKITLLSLIKYLEKHFINNVEYLKLSNLTCIPFEDLISFFFLQKPQILLQHYDKLGADEVENKKYFLTKDNDYFNITHLDLSNNNFSTTKTLFALLSKTKDTHHKVEEVDSEIDFYFYFKNRSKNLKHKSPLKNILKSLDNDGSEMDFTFDFSPEINHPAMYDTMLPKLVYLNLSGNLLLTPKTLSLVLQHLPNLDTLDLTSCSNLDNIDFLAESPCKDTLKNLILHGLRISCLESTPEILTKLVKLECLDISEPSGKLYRLDIPSPTFPMMNRRRTFSTNNNTTTINNINTFIENNGLINNNNNNNNNATNEINNNNNNNNEEDNAMDSITAFEEEHNYLVIPVRTPVHLIISSRNFPNLKKIDLSGVAGLSPISLLNFMELHPNLEFLGLMLSHVNYDPRLVEFFDQQTHLIVAGECNEAQCVNALKSYSDRPGYIQKALQRLFSFSRDVKEPDPIVIHTITDHIALNPTYLGINLAGTACLYNLIKIPDIGKYMPLSLATHVVTTCLDAMSNFSSNQQLQKNVVLLLCNDWIINNVEFDRFRCTCLVLDCLCTYKDNRMIQMCAAITSLIVAKMTVEEVNQLGSKSQYIKRFLEIILEKVLNYQHDSILKLCLSAMWNLTDESPKTCISFIKNNGLRVYYEAFQSFGDDPSILTKFLGSLSNVSEVPQLKPAFLKRPGFTRKLFELAEYSTPTTPFAANVTNDLSENSHQANIVSVSYFACGICAHLLSCAEDEDEYSTAALLSLEEKSYTDVVAESATEMPPPSSNLTNTDNNEAIDNETDGSGISTRTLIEDIIRQGTSSPPSPLRRRPNTRQQQRRLLADRDGLPPTKKDINELLCRVVLSWPEPNVEMVSYRSFKPFLGLLKTPFAHDYGAHIWAIWAIKHVCSKNPERYTLSMVKEGGDKFLIEYRKNLLTRYRSCNDNDPNAANHGQALSSPTFEPYNLLEPILNDLFKIIFANADNTNANKYKQDKIQQLTKLL